MGQKRQHDQFALAKLFMGQCGRKFIKIRLKTEKRHIWGKKPIILVSHDAK